MNTTTLTLHRSAHRRLLDEVRAWFARHRRARHMRLALQGLDRHLLRDIGIDAAAIETLEARSHARDMALRMRAYGGF